LYRGKVYFALEFSFTNVWVRVVLEAVLWILETVEREIFVVGHVTT
jgi:hypothetical protein